MVRDWSICLLVAQILICGYLFNYVVTLKVFYGSYGEKIFYGAFLIHAAWVFFLASILVSAFLLLRLPELIENVSDSADDDSPGLGKMFVIDQVPLSFVRYVQTALFALGIVVLMLVTFVTPVP